MDIKEFPRKWMLTNFLGMWVSYMLYTPLAHGFTGTHGRELTQSQFLAHCGALAFVALTLFTFQRSVLKNFIKVPWSRIFIGAVVFNLLFWLGYYLPVDDGPDFDILFGFLALGSALWIGTIPFKGNAGPYLIALISFPLASFVVEALMLLTVLSFDIKVDVQSGMLQHTIFWLVIGVFTGLLGGWISGRALSKMLAKMEPHQPT